MKCKNCEDGYILVEINHVEYVSRDMAYDAGDPQLEGMQIDTGTEYDYDICDCCDGEYENCERCRMHKDDF